MFELQLTEIDFHFGSNLEILLMKLNSNANEFLGKGTCMRFINRSVLSGPVCCFIQHRQCFYDRWVFRIIYSDVSTHDHLKVSHKFIKLALPFYLHLFLYFFNYYFLSPILSPCAMYPLLFVTCAFDYHIIKDDHAGSYITLKTSLLTAV